MEESIFKIEIIKEYPERAIISLGDSVLGGGEAQQFSLKLQELITSGVKKIAVNLSEVELMNSSGMGMLIAGHSASKKREVKFALTNVPEKIISLFEMTHLNKVFEIYNTFDSFFEEN